MEIETRHSPGFGVLRAKLGPNEEIKAESGAMLATSGDVEVESKMQGGLMKGLKRSVLGGESLFISTFRAGAQGGWADFAARLPGDCVHLDVDGVLNISRGSWLCSENGVELDTKWGGFKNLAGGEGGFLVRATGQGKVGLACYGALDVLDLAAGESVVVDSGHMVAYSEGVNLQTRKVAKGLMQSLKSGEGLVFEFTGPGKLWIQSRNPTEFLGWLTAELPFSRA